MKSPLSFQTLLVVCLVTCYFSATAGIGRAAVTMNSEAAAISPSKDGAASSSSELLIPGPLRSFLRMAGISQQISPGDVLPKLAWNVSTMGYQAGDRPTEYLILLTRYVKQARELAVLAGSEGVIRVSSCIRCGAASSYPRLPRCIRLRTAWDLTADGGCRESFSYNRFRVPSH